MNGKPDISIVTPSYNMLTYLPRCHASVADQGLVVEHVVMDGGSTDGTAAWLKQHPEIVSSSEKDNGMYHALNKAIDKSTADIVGHLNCDEQYLPGTLKYIYEYFETHPEIDFIAGNFLVVDPEGSLISYRKSFKPIWQFFFSNYLYTTTCTLFYRRKIFKTCRFDESYRSIADVIFLYGVIRKGFKGTHLQRYFATFTYSGENLSLDPVSIAEKKRFNATLPLGYKLLRPAFFFLFFLMKLINGNYREGRELSYDIYLREQLNSRTRMKAVQPTFRLRFTK